MKPSLPLMLLALLVLCLAIPATHGVATYVGVYVVGGRFGPEQMLTIAVVVASISAVVGFWHWWDVFAYRGPKLGSDFEPRDPGWCLATVSVIHLVAMPTLLTAAFCVGLYVAKEPADAELSFAAYPRGYQASILFVFPLAGFLLCRWFAKVEGQNMPDRGLPLQAGSGN